jgi:nucleotide-binding universal stress UspA family protein
MTTGTRDLVVVGVDGSEANLGALRYAVAEARALGSVLELVHVVPDLVPVSPFLPVTPDELTATGTTILRTAEDAVRSIDADLSVESWLHHGWRAGELVGAAAGARVLVVGRDDRPLVERVLRGDTATGVAARAHVPVVEVPADWRPPDPGTRPVLLVGVKSRVHAAALLSDAFREAAKRCASLLVLHAWRLPSVYDDIIGSRADADAWAATARTELEVLLRSWRDEYPEIPVEIRVVHDRAGHALIEASRDADLVLVVRRAHGVPPALHLGGVARAVLRSAHCPVRVVPPIETATLPGLLPEQSGSLTATWPAEPHDEGPVRMVDRT